MGFCFSWEDWSSFFSQGCGSEQLKAIPNPEDQNDYQTGQSGSCLRSTDLPRPTLLLGPHSRAAGVRWALTGGAAEELGRLSQGKRERGWFPSRSLRCPTKKAQLWVTLGKQQLSTSVP